MDVHGETNGLGIFFCVCLGDPTIYKVYLKKKKKNDCWQQGGMVSKFLKYSISSHKRPYSNKCPPPNKPPPPIIVWNKHSS